MPQVGFFYVEGQPANNIGDSCLIQYIADTVAHANIGTYRSDESALIDRVNVGGGSAKTHSYDVGVVCVSDGPEHHSFSSWSRHDRDRCPFHESVISWSMRHDMF